MAIAVDICVPVFNEEALLEKNIVGLLKFCREQVFGLEWNIVILVNGSTDHSASIAERLSRTYPEISSVVIKEGGKGRALKEYAKLSTSDLLFYMDVDLAVSLYHIPQFLDIIRTASESPDMVIASRLLPDSRIDRSWVREISSRTYSFVSRWIIKDNIKDKQCGFKIIRTSSFHSLLPYIKDDHWFFDTELVVHACSQGCKIKEVPVDWEENRYDRRQSKIRLGRDSFKFLWSLYRLKKRIGRNEQGY